MGMRCNCGYELPLGARYCSKCGNDVVSLYRLEELENPYTEIVSKLKWVRATSNYDDYESINNAIAYYERMEQAWVLTEKELEKWK